MENLFYSAGFDRFALVHHQHPVGDIRHHAHIVSDKNHSHLHLVLQHFDQLQNLRLNGDIQRGGRLIGNQYRRTTGERHGDHHPLAHPARELMRVASQNGVGLRDPHLLQHTSGFGQRLIAAQPLVQADRLGNLLPYREDRIERGHRLLKNHGDVSTTHAAHLGGTEGGEIAHLAIAAAQQQAVACHQPARLFNQAHQRQGGHRLTGAGLADDRQRLAAFQRKREVFYRRDRLPFVGKGDIQVAHRQHLLAVKFIAVWHPFPLIHGKCRCSAYRRHSPRRGTSLRC